MVLYPHVCLWLFRFLRSDECFVKDVKFKLEIIMFKKHHISIHPISCCFISLTNSIIHWSRGSFDRGSKWSLCGLKWYLYNGYGTRCYLTIRWSGSCNWMKRICFTAPHLPIAFSHHPNAIPSQMENMQVLASFFPHSTTMSIYFSSCSRVLFFYAHLLCCGSWPLLLFVSLFVSVVLAHGLFPPLLTVIFRSLDRFLCGEGLMARSVALILRHFP